MVEVVDDLFVFFAAAASPDGLSPLFAEFQAQWNGMGRLLLLMSLQAIWIALWVAGEANWLHQQQQQLLSCSQRLLKFYMRAYWMMVMVMMIRQGLTTLGVNGERERKVMVMAYFAEGHLKARRGRGMQIASCLPVLLWVPSVLFYFAYFGSILYHLRPLEGRWRCKEKKMKFF